MIKLENVVLPSPVQWNAVVMGARNPMNSWSLSDSYTTNITDCEVPLTIPAEYFIGEKDLALLKKLANAGSDHRKFMRMIPVYVDITAPLYWWKEFDTYKIGTVANSCSTMHKIHEKEFMLEDFSTEHLEDFSWNRLSDLIGHLNICREKFIETKEKKYWQQMIQLLPSSYNQKRTVMLNYEVLRNIYHARKNHKLDEWARHNCTTTDHKEWGKKVNLGFCDWIETLPYAKELIIGED